MSSSASPWPSANDLLAQGDDLGALRVLRLVLEADPGNRDASQAVAVIMARQLREQGAGEAAMNLLDQVLETGQGPPLAWGERGRALLDLGRANEALDSFARAEGDVDALNGRAVAWAQLGQLDAALEAVQRVLASQPDHRTGLLNRQVILLEQMRLHRALETGSEALRHHPGDADLHWIHAIVLLLLGRFSEGWAEFEWRWRSSANRDGQRMPIRSRRWTGTERLAGSTIVLLAEQGVGDTFQMLRFVPALSEMGARVRLKVPVSLANLSILRPFGAQVDVDPEDADFHCPLLSLPGALRVDESSMPGPVPFLAAPANLVESWRNRCEALGKGLKVGVAWSGNAAHVNDFRRSMPLSLMAALETPGCRFISLVPKVRERDRAACNGWTSLLHWGPELGDWDETAALIHNLDLVVSVDTAVAHLAGAMGKPVWILLPRVPDWRWMADREDSPWYPTARLFRQGEQSDWASALARVRQALGEWAEKRAGPSGSPG